MVTICLIKAVLPVLQMDALYLITIRSDVPIDDIAENSKPCLAVSLSWWWCLYHESLNTRSWFRLHTRKIVTIPQWDDRITASSIGWDPPNFWIPSDRTFLAYLWQSLVGLKWAPMGEAQEVWCSCSGSARHGGEEWILQLRVTRRVNGTRAIPWSVEPC